MGNVGQAIKAKETLDECPIYSSSNIMKI